MTIIREQWELFLAAYNLQAQIRAEKQISSEVWFYLRPEQRQYHMELMFGPGWETTVLQVDVARSKSEPTIPASLLAAASFSHARYENLVAATWQTVQELAKLKGGEYSGDTDRLLNFRRNAADLNLPMEAIWRVYAAKHWDAIGQYIRDVKDGKDRTRLEGLSGRADDLIVYLLLFKAMLEERDVK